METRIKVITDGNGNSLYYPQYKGLFFWRDYSTLYENTVVFPTLGRAQNFLNKQYENVTYIKYPDGEAS